MIKNKKLLFLSAVISVAPIMIVASCSNNTPTENPMDPIIPIEPPEPIDPSEIDDSIKAMANVKLLLAQETYLKVKSLQPNENILSSLPRLEPKKNFNFETTYNFIEKDIEKGEMKVEIILKRGKEEIKEIITIDGFLTPEIISNEYDDFVNPQKVLSSPKGKNGVFLLEDRPWFPGPGSYWPLPFPPNVSESARILEANKHLLLAKPQAPSNELIWIMPEKGYKEPVSWENNFGFETGISRINFRLYKKENPKIRSRVLVAEIRRKNDKPPSWGNPARYAFNTFYTPVNNEAYKFKASEINTQEKLLSILDLEGSKDIPQGVKELYSQIDLGRFFYRPELANDKEGSLMVPLKRDVRGFIKLYGFKIDTKD